MLDYIVRAKSDNKPQHTPQFPAFLSPPVEHCRMKFQTKINRQNIEVETIMKFYFLPSFWASASSFFSIFSLIQSKSVLITIILKPIQIYQLIVQTFCMYCIDIPFIVKSDFKLIMHPEHIREYSVQFMNFGSSEIYTEIDESQTYAVSLQVQCTYYSQQVQTVCVVYEIKIHFQS